LSVFGIFDKECFHDLKKCYYRRNHDVTITEASDGLDVVVALRVRR